jgi:hypothetical protein
MGIREIKRDYDDHEMLVDRSKHIFVYYARLLLVLPVSFTIDLTFLLLAQIFH